MRKRTTTQKLHEAITDNLLHITKAEIYYKTSRKTETIDVAKIHENLSFLCEAGIFSDAIGWHYERDHKLNGYIAETGRMNPDTEIIVIVYLGICEGVIGEKIEKILEVTEEE